MVAQNFVNLKSPIQELRESEFYLILLCSFNIFFKSNRFFSHDPQISQNFEIEPHCSRNNLRYRIRF